jgi:hypothetical protein
MDGAFLNLVRGNRLSALMGLKLPEGVTAPKYGPQYHYVEIPVGQVLKDGEPVSEGKIVRNQHVEIVAACTIKVRGQHPVMVVYNHDLQRVANLGSFHVVHPSGDEAMAPSFWATFRKDCEVVDIPWAVRLYLLT